jgi:hypothetical protein
MRYCLYGLKDGGDFHHEEIQWVGLAGPVLLIPSMFLQVVE